MYPHVPVNNAVDQIVMIEDLPAHAIELAKQLYCLSSPISSCFFSRSKP